MANESFLEDLFQRWQQLLSPFGAAQKNLEQSFAQLVNAYSKPDRYYHTLEHIYQVLQTIEALQGYAVDIAVIDIAVIQLAAWFHDSIYTAQAADNEEQSAAYAQKILQDLNVTPERILSIQQLILATKHHTVDAREVDTQILLDADLAILGADWETYKIYAQRIRQEYAWVPEAAYRIGRRQVLENFLQRDRIFHTPPMQAQPEFRARANLKKEIMGVADSGDELGVE